MSVSTVIYWISIRFGCLGRVRGYKMKSSTANVYVCVCMYFMSLYSFHIRTFIASLKLLAIQREIHSEELLWWEKNNNLRHNEKYKDEMCWGKAMYAHMHATHTHQTDLCKVRWFFYTQISHYFNNKDSKWKLSDNGKNDSDSNNNDTDTNNNINK